MSQWWAMGGYGAYVWTSFAVTAAGYLWMALAGRSRPGDVLDDEDDDA
jgi:heme exporter protein D